MAALAPTRRAYTRKRGLLKPIAGWSVSEIYERYSPDNAKAYIVSRAMAFGATKAELLGIAADYDRRQNRKRRR